MEYTFILTLSILIFLGVFGSYLLWKNITIKLEKNLSNQISALIIDGIKIYGLRAFSAIFQLLLYTSIVLFILSKILNKQFLWDQIGAFFLGGITMSICLFILSGIIPKLIPKILEKSKIYLANCMTIQFETVFSLGFISVSILITNALLLIYFTSYKLLIGYSLGIIFSSFFTRISGGLFKSSSNIGTGICQLRYPDLPEEDSRNPGHILIIASHYIHKICGFCADLLGTYIISFLSTIIFAYACMNNLTISESTFNQLKNLPLLIIFISILGSILGYLFAQYRIKKNALQNTLLESLYIAITTCAIGTYIAIQSLSLDIAPSIWVGPFTFKPFIAYLAGLFGAIFICYTSEVLTTTPYPFAKKCAKESEFGPTNIQLYAMGLGLKSNLIYLIYILSIALTAYFSAGLYGISIASLAMLSLTTTIISINTFSPLAQSTSQIAILSTTSTPILNHTKKMHTLGQSTIAIGNVYATVSSIFACLSLITSSIFLKNYSLHDLFTLDLLWLIGAISGVIIPLAICGYLIESCRKTAKFVSSEIKRQFDQIPYLTQGKANPDIISCSDKIVRQCMDNLIIPGILLALIPILFGYLINVGTVLAFSIGALLSMISITFYWAIAGDLMNNAKYYIDQGKLGGKSSPFYSYISQTRYLSSIFKDILNPSLSIIIKAIISLTTIIMIFLT